jgi:transglutaminase-like putative cysteine protease
MKISGFFITSLILIISYGCRETANDCTGILKQIVTEFDAGNISKVQMLSDSIKRVCPDNQLLIHKSDSISQIAERIKLDFPYTESMIVQELREKIGTYVPEEKAEWERKNWLESEKIDGEKRYFSRAVSNLNLLRNFYLYRSGRDSIEASDPEIVYRKRHTQLIIKASEDGTNMVLPVNMTINYTLTVDADAVPAGETLRCWLPYPKENNPRQNDIVLLSASPGNYIIAPDSAMHRTIYMEGRAEKGVPLVFRFSCSFKSYGQYFDPDKMNIRPYDRSSELYKKYTSEQLPNICFTENVKHIADSISGSDDKPSETVRKFYYWFTNNIPWTGAREYSIIPNIPEYVIRNKRGDCGMQTLLFMSMLRYKGIPVRWQSGWKLPPDAKNLHDWCEVYYEGTGWVPVDISYGLQYSEDKKTKEFYVSGIDSYRLIVNEGVAGILYPEKRFLRSEPFDFQRGEVEWNGGNLYFDKWDYNMEIIYN